MVDLINLTNPEGGQEQEKRSRRRRMTAPLIS
jgi:hypothetical protein